MKLNPCLTAYKKINSKWIKDLNVSPETVKLLEEHVWGKLHDIGLFNNFMDMTPKAQTIKIKVNKWYYLKLNASAQAWKPLTE